MIRKERLESKIIPRFRAEETGCIVVFEEIVKCGIVNFRKLRRKSNKKKFSFSRVER